MIFLGDIASPSSTCSNQLLESLKANSAIFENSCVIANLEGLFSRKAISSNRPIIYNDPSVIDSLKLINTKVVSLANNHVPDLPDNYDESIKLLNDNDIKYCGIGTTVNESELPAFFEWEGKKVVVLAFTWDVLFYQKSNSLSKFHVSKINPSHVIDLISNIHNKEPDAVIILIMHWNFDMESIPFPLHRTFSRAMIDAGASLIIGSHSHCVQGGERYKNGLIVYGLGNFFFPWYEFNNGTSHFPDWTRLELAFDWDIKSNEAKCHWFKYNYIKGKHSLTHLSTENFDNGKLINQYSPYRGMNDQTYLNWFKRNRRKKFLLPVYRDHREHIRNSMIDSYLKVRIPFARLLARYKLRSWNR